MKNVNGLNKVYGVLSCGVPPGGPCNEQYGRGGENQCPGSPCQGNFHVYRIEVDLNALPEKLTWSADGVAYNTVTGGHWYSALEAGSAT
jgi:hypothetical protein